MTDDLSKMLRRILIASFLLATGCLAQTGATEPAARRGIDDGNQAWVDGMKKGDVALVAATYTEDALDCDSKGVCISGRAAIEQHMKEQITKLGRASSASVHSAGSVQQGDFVYEWGHAEAEFVNGKKVAEQYLTAWQKQRGGGWKIFRNMVIPDGTAR